MNELKCINKVLVKEISDQANNYNQSSVMTVADFPFTSHFDTSSPIIHKSTGNCNLITANISGTFVGQPIPVHISGASNMGNLESQDSNSRYPEHSAYGSPRLGPEQIKHLARSSRYWESIKTPNKSNKKSFPFLIMSYNILAQTLLENHMYLYRQCEPESLAWSIRLTKIYNEIVSVNPDVLCLQEVETSHLNSIAVKLDKLGFTGIFKRKTGVKVDGCAIFFKTAMFDVIDCHSVEFLQPNIRLLDRDNIGLMLKLVPKANPSSPFVVCTTHFLYNPRRTDVRLAQTQVFLAEIDRFSYVFDENKKNYGHLPIVMTGDLNSFPNTPVTNLIADGSINLDTVFPHMHDLALTNACQHLEVYLRRSKPERISEKSLSLLYHSEMKESYNISRNTEIMKDYEHLFRNGFIRHNLNFTSVYKHQKENGEAEASTYQDEWVTVDYIYYSSSNLGKLNLVERYRLPTANECAQIGHIPNSHYGSDHLSLAAKFILQYV